MVFIQSEGIGSIPRPESLINALQSGDAEAIKIQQDEALADTIAKLSAITNGRYPITDGEQVFSTVLSVNFCYVYIALMLRLSLASLLIQSQALRHSTQMGR